MNDSEQPTARTTTPRQNTAPRYGTAPRQLPSVQQLPSSQQSTEPLRAPARRQATAPPTTPCTVVWSQGRPYVLENAAGRPRWMGTDRHGRPQALTGDELRRRGWSYHRTR